jgi:hypothetical protein
VSDASGTWPWRMEDCDQEATAERHRQCYVYPDRAFQEIERLRERVRWHAGVLSRAEINAAIAADAATPEEPSGEVDGPAMEAAARAVYGVIRDIKNPLGKTWAELTEAERRESYRLARAALEAGRDA